MLSFRSEFFARPCRACAEVLQNRFTSLKHSMQFLLARVMFRQNSRAAMKFLDSTIEDMEAYVTRQALASKYDF